MKRGPRHYRDKVDALDAITRAATRMSQMVNGLVESGPAAMRVVSTKELIKSRQDLEYSLNRAERRLTQLLEEDSEEENAS